MKRYQKELTVRFHTCILWRDLKFQIAMQDDNSIFNIDLFDFVADRPVADRSMANRSLVDRSLIERSFSGCLDRSVADRSVANSPVTDRSVADRSLGTGLTALYNLTVLCMLL